MYDWSNRNNFEQLERIPDTLTQRLQTVSSAIYSFTMRIFACLLYYRYCGDSYVRKALSHAIFQLSRGHGRCTADASSLWLHQCVSALHNHRPLAETQLVLLRRRYGKYVSSAFRYTQIIHVIPTWRNRTALEWRFTRTAVSKKIFAWNYI